MNRLMHLKEVAMNGNAGTGVPTGQLDLKQFVIVLDDGQLSEADNTEADVDAIFDVHIPAFSKVRGGGPVPVVFWSHGGLVTKENALTTAMRDAKWWLSNGIYPVYFAWDSGLVQTIVDLAIEGAVSTAVAARQPDRLAEFRFTDISDNLIEIAVRAAGGPGVWQAMKDTAMKASAANGGAGRVAAKLQGFTEENPGTTLHAVGHSAGAIFHSFFIPAVLQPGTVTFETLALLAPAIRTDAFKSTLEPTIGNGIQSVAMFTMNEGYERDDNVLGKYRKSLLYLIRGALEPQPGANLLGLQECVLNDTDLTTLFEGAPAATHAEVTWSVSTSGPPRSRSASTSHAGFVTDAATMDSVARRILDTDNIISYGAAPHPGILAAAAPVMVR